MCGADKCYYCYDYYNHLLQNKTAFDFTEDLSTSVSPG